MQLKVVIVLESFRLRFRFNRESFVINLEQFTERPQVNSVTFSAEEACNSTYGGMHVVT